MPTIHHLEFRNLIFEGTTVQFDNGTVNIRMSDIEIRNTGGDGLKVGAPAGQQPPIMSSPELPYI